MRVKEGRQALQAANLSRGCFAFGLGGFYRRMLFLVAAAYPHADRGPDAVRTGHVLTY